MIMVPPATIPAPGQSPVGRWVRQPRRMAALGRAARTAIVSFAGFAIGQWAVGEVQVAVFATFTGLALLGIADFGGTMRGRCGAIAGAAVTGFALAALGTWASSQPVWADAVVTAVTGAGIVTIALLGGYLTAGASAVTLFYLIAVGSPAPMSVIGQRLAGIAIGGALCAIGAVTLWPTPVASPALDVLAGRLDQLARRLRAVPGARPAAAGEPAATMPVRSVIDALEERPASPTAADRAALYLLNDTERLDSLLRRINPAALTGAEREAAARLATDVQESSAKLTTLARSSRPAVPSRPGPPGTGTGTGVRPYSLMARAAIVTANISRHVGVITRGSTASSPQAGTRFASGTSSPRVLIVHGLLRVRANMTWRSVHLQDAVRLGVALGLAVAAARVLGLQHGFWVALATLTIVRSKVSATGRRASQALAGTAVGFAVAFAIIEAAGTNTGVYAALTPVVIFAAIYASNAIGFPAGQAAFTVAVLVLFSLLAPAGWRIGVVRVEDVAAGALIGLAVGAVAWPRGPQAAIGPAIADLLDASSRYLTRTLWVMAGGQAGQPGAGTEDLGGRDPNGLARARQSATSAAIVAESAFAAYLATRPRPAAVRETVSYLSAVSRLWYAADILRTRPAGEPGSPRWDTLAPLARALADTADRTARRLRGQRAQPTPPSGPAQPRLRADPPGYPEDSLEGWIDDLTRQLAPDDAVTGPWDAGG